MVKADLASMSVEALLQLRDNVGRILSGKADELQQAARHAWGRGLDSFGQEDIGRPEGSSLKGRKVAPKYATRKTGRRPGQGVAQSKVACGRNQKREKAGGFRY